MFNKIDFFKFWLGPINIFPPGIIRATAVNPLINENSIGSKAIYLVLDICLQAGFVETNGTKYTLTEHGASILKRCK